MLSEGAPGGSAVLPCYADGFMPSSGDLAKLAAAVLLPLLGACAAPPEPVAPVSPPPAAPAPPAAKPRTRMGCAETLKTLLEFANTQRPEEMGSAGLGRESYIEQQASYYDRIAGLFDRIEGDTPALEERMQACRVSSSRLAEAARRAQAALGRAKAAKEALRQEAGALQAKDLPEIERLCLPSPSEECRRLGRVMEEAPGVGSDLRAFADAQEAFLERLRREPIASAALRDAVVRLADRLARMNGHARTAASSLAESEREANALGPAGNVFRGAVRSLQSTCTAPVEGGA
jgi:hypothetical protein